VLFKVTQVFRGFIGSCETLESIGASSRAPLGCGRLVELGHLCLGLARQRGSIFTSTLHTEPHIAWSWERHAKSCFV
jgi:hypothetical protein